MKPGNQIGRYLLIDEIGRGGMGVVYRAYDSEKKRDVALKIIKPAENPQVSPEQLKRFDREFQIVARLDHPHIIKVFEVVDSSHPTPYIVMEYLTGSDLRQRLTQPLPWQQVLTLLRPLAEALAYTHRVKVFHRDLKPSNVMFTGNERDTLKLVDFGLAYQVESSRLTISGHIMGTPAYLSPEQARGEIVDGRTDIFALGIIICEAILGRNPLERGSVISTLQEVTSDRPVDISSLQGHVPPPVLKLIRWAVAKNRAERYPSCELLLADLDRCLGHSPSGSTTMPAGTSTEHKVDIQVAEHIRLSEEIKAVLRRVFKESKRILVEAEFGRAFSGSRVFRIYPIDDQRKLLPSVVKVAPVGLIEQEWLVYRQWVKDTLIGIAQIEAPPLLTHDEVQWDALRYLLVGGDIFKVENLSDYCRRPETGSADIRRVLAENLFKVLHQQWWRNSTPRRILLQTDYDDILPVNLVLMPSNRPAGQSDPIIEPEVRPSPDLALGEPVQLKNFVITEIDHHPPALTLNLPAAAQDRSSSYRLRITDIPGLAPYRVGHVLGAMPLTVKDTRSNFLLQKAKLALGENVALTGDRLILASGLNLPNPLKLYPSLLQTFREVRIGTIHGDLNMENVLVLENGQVSLIDFATVRPGHILHDLLRLETDTLLKLVAPALPQANLPAETICTLYQQLHREVGRSAPPLQPEAPHSSLEKSLTLLGIIRHMALKCLLDPEDWGEYYQGLILYLLGALKFVRANSPAVEGQILILGAATAAGLMRNELPVPTEQPSEPESKIQEQNKGGDPMPAKEEVQPPSRESGGTTIKGDRNIGGSVNTGGGSVVFGDQIIQAGPQKVPILDLLKRARNLLGQTNYKTTIEVCEQILEEEPEHPEANLLIAIALMYGRGADQLRDNIIARLENHLQAAFDAPETEATALAVLGIVKYDHYIANGLLAGKPSFKEIKERLQAAGGAEAVEPQLLKLVKVSLATLKRLNLLNSDEE